MMRLTFQRKTLFRQALNRPKLVYSIFCSSIFRHTDDPRLDFLLACIFRLIVSHLTRALSNVMYQPWNKALPLVKTSDMTLNIKITFNSVDDIDS